MLKLNNILEHVYKQGCYTFAFAHYQVSFGNLRGRRLSTRKKGVVRLLQSLAVNYRGRCGGGEVRLKIAVAIFLTPCY